MTPKREAEIRKMLISEDVEIVELFVGIEDLLAEIDRLRESLRQRDEQIDILAHEVEDVRDEHMRACNLVAKMHRAATGGIVGPKRGVVEDVEDLFAAHARLVDAFNFAKDLDALREALKEKP